MWVLVLLDCEQQWKTVCLISSLFYGPFPKVHTSVMNIFHFANETFLKGKKIICGLKVHIEVSYFVLHISFCLYRIYSRISRGFLDNFLIKNWVGRGIKVEII